MPLISVVIPVYKAESCLKELYTRLVNSLSPLTTDFEIIMVEDVGGDDSWSIIEDLAQKDSRVRGIRLSRNFGQHAAITAGLDNSSGEWIVIMDCDLQDQPEEIPKMYAFAQKGYDVVSARRKIRYDSFLRRISSKYFYAILGYLTDTKQDPSIANFGIYSRKAIEAVRQMRENLRYFPAMIQWAGFQSASVDVEHTKREGRKSSYTLKKLLHLALSVMVSFSEKPLRLAVKIGFSLSSLSLLYALFIFLRAVFIKQAVPGWSSLIVSIWFLSGLIILFLGIVGIYIGKVFEEVKRRPLYIIDKKTAE